MYKNGQKLFSHFVQLSKWKQNLNISFMSSRDCILTYKLFDKMSPVCSNCLHWAVSSFSGQFFMHASRHQEEAQCLVHHICCRDCGSPESMIK